MVPVSLEKVTLPRGAVGKDITSEVPTVLPSSTIGEIQSRLTEFAKDNNSIDYIYVINDEHHLIGVISVKELSQYEPSQIIRDVMVKQLVVSHPQVKKSRVAHLAIKHNIKAVPIVDEKNKFLGVLESDDILAILYDEHRRLMNKRAGIVTIDDTFGTILDYGIWKSFISRLPWIIIGLIGGTFAARIIQEFEIVLSQNLLVASFMPLVVYISSAVGNQTQIFFVRDIAFNMKLAVSKYTIKQFITTLLLGSVCAVLIYTFINVMWHSNLAIAISIAIFTSIASSTLISVFVPFGLIKLNQDPAVGSGPFATILQDLLSISIYFGIVSYFVAM